MVRYVRNSSVTISTSSTLISESKIGGARRVVLELCNNNAIGGNDIFVGVDTEAVSGKGRRIQPGQTISWSTDSLYSKCPVGIVRPKG